MEESHGTINILDVQTCVNLILANQYEIAADCNDDGRVDVVDIQAIVDTILGE
jgi:hypothetical protein